MQSEKTHSVKKPLPVSENGVKVKNESICLLIVTGFYECRTLYPMYMSFIVLHRSKCEKMKTEFSSEILTMVDKSVKGAKMDAKPLCKYTVWFITSIILTTHRQTINV